MSFQRALDRRLTRGSYQLASTNPSQSALFKQLLQRLARFGSGRGLELGAVQDLPLQHRAVGGVVDETQEPLGDVVGIGRNVGSV